MQFEDFLVRLKQDYPELKFRLGKRFKFCPPRSISYLLPTICADRNCATLAQTQPDVTNNSHNDNNCNFPPEQNYYFLQLLHEVGHALLKHSDFATDAERVVMECAAWAKAKELCTIYNIDYDEDFAESELDTYRDWLHQKSRCRECGLTRYQDAVGKYHCPFCETYCL